MKINSIKFIIVIILFLSNISAFAGVPPNTINTSPKISIGLLTGYNNGFGFGTQIKFSDFAEGFPFELRIGAGMNFLNPGSALQARDIFINGNTNGTPETKGQFFDARIDFLINMPELKFIKPYVGAHYTNFKGNFVYVGGNEDFDVTTSSWGIGAGIDGEFPVSNKIAFIITLGSGYYFPNTLKGHDTYYTPDDENVNPRRDYVYKDADRAINQPKIELRFMGGFSFKL